MRYRVSETEILHGINGCVRSGEAFLFGITGRPRWNSPAARSGVAVHATVHSKSILGYDHAPCDYRVSGTGAEKGGLWGLFWPLPRALLRKLGFVGAARAAANQRKLGF